MRKSGPLLGLSALLLYCAAPAQDQVTPREITAATRPAPADLQDGAAVYARTPDGGLELLRRGGNGLMCLTNDPARKRFQVVCYHESLEPFMARGRQLRLEGLDRAAVDSTRQAEIEAGTLEFPDHPAALYSLNAKANEVEPETGLPAETRPLAVVYLPYATAQSTGLTTTPAPGVPWLMYEGAPWAHVMISP